MASPTNARETILAAVKAANAPLKERAPYPQYDPDITRLKLPQKFANDWEYFCFRMRAVNGVPLTGYPALGEYLRKQNLTEGYCDPLYAMTVVQHAPHIKWATNYDARLRDSYPVAITMASGAIAETGTVILKDADTSSRVAALAPWIHVALVRRNTLVGTLAEGVKTFKGDPAVIFVTGPSKTADVEGILIEGVHGPGIQVACLID